MGSNSIQEREAELAALQSAFDEYISSSRELEEELDAELAKMQSKLAESSAANAALSAQLESMAPQLTQLETALTQTKYQLETSQSQLRQAESKAEEYESRLRQVEATVLSLRQDADDAQEMLAFKESELEDALLELEVERERFRVELKEVQLDLQQQQQQRSANVNATGSPAAPTTSIYTSNTNGLDTPSPTTHSTQSGGNDDNDDDDNDDYAKRLEDELELVTEQLIETEQRLTAAEDLVLTLEQSKDQQQEKLLSMTVQERELESLQEQHALTTDLLQKQKEEFELVQEELQLTQEELKAAEEDLAQQKSLIESTLVPKVVLSELQESYKIVQSELRTNTTALKEMEVALTKSMTDSDKQAQQVDLLEQALWNSAKDVTSLSNDLEQLEGKFDAACKEAEKVGYETGRQEGIQITQQEWSIQVSKLETQVSELKQEIIRLQQQLKAQEEMAATAAAPVAGTEEQIAATDRDAVTDKQIKDDAIKIQKLMGQLVTARSAEESKTRELEELQQIVSTRVTKAEENVARLEKELSQTKGKLYEAEAHLIVSSKKQIKSAAAATASMEEINVLSNSLSMDMDDKHRARSTSPDTLYRLKTLLSEEHIKVTALQKEVDELKDQARMEERHSKHLEGELVTLQKQLFVGSTPVVQQMSRLSQLGTSMASVGNQDQGNGVFGEEELSQIEQLIQSRDVDAMGTVLRSLETKSNMQREYNAQLLSKILSLQGNIQVCCRVRPLSVNEIKAGAKNNVEAFSETELGCFDNRQSKWKPFAFDKVWGPDQTQRNIFRDVEPLALSVVDGFNACIFAYGQTGSGKTYTMEGSTENNDYGISYRTIQKIFNLLNLRAQQQKAASNISGESKSSFAFKMRLGMLEIYNDEIYDLLAAHSQAGTSKADQKREAKKAGVKATLDIRRIADGRIEVPDLIKEPVESIDDVMSLLKRGNASRATATTNLNEHSSRSHMVLMVDVESGLEGEPSNKGILYLVDLAGSERVRNSQVEGEQLKEATFINKSLSALGNVMEALDRKAMHVPYRDSKLTYLLQDAVGGNSRTMMIVAVCPTDVSHDESVHALQFATRVRRIQIGAAQRNVTSKNLEETVKSLAAELKALSKAKESSETQLINLKKDNARIQERLQTISTQRSKASAENSIVEVLRKTNTDMNARLAKEKELRDKVVEELERSKTDVRKKQSEYSKLVREKDGLQRKLEEHEIILEKAVKEARTAKDASSAANLRARKAQIIGSRHSNAVPPRTPLVPASTSSRISSSANSPANSMTSHAASNPSRIPIPTPTLPTKPDTTSVAAVAAPAPASSMAVPTTPKVDVTHVRQEVLALLEKYDKGKVDRINVIMEKFKGNEEVLVEKMKQRYESNSSTMSASSSMSSGGGNHTASLNLQRRSEMALQRHKERMQKKLEQQQQSQPPKGGSGA